MNSDDRTRIQPEMVRAAVGTQLSGIYELDEHLGSGGMAEVYRGHNIQTGDLVAVKIVLPEFARDETILSLFRKEASILNHLSHDAVVRYHVFTIDPGIGRPYLAMEFVNGQPLSEVIRKGPVPPTDVGRLCLRLAAGLGAVHEANVFHRDLSPDNIILPEGRVERAKIIDFGIARSAHIGDATLIGGRFAGKYSYVSPEQLGLFGGEVSERSDIYSLGLVLAAALRGKALDMSGSQWEVIEKRRSVPDLTGIDSDFLPILGAMLQPDPQDRPASMGEVAELVVAGLGLEEPGTLKPSPRAWSSDQSADSGDEIAEPRPPYFPGAPPSKSSSPSRTLSAAPPPPHFVEHVSPPILSRPAHNVAGLAGTRPTRTRNLVGLSLAAVVVVPAVGAYFTGVIWPVAQREATPLEEEIARDAPDPPPVETDEGATLREQAAETTHIDDPSEDDGAAKQSAQDDVSTPATEKSGSAEATTPTQTETATTPSDMAIIERLLDQPDIDKGSADEDVAMLDPDSEPEPEIVSDLTQRASWLRSFAGGDCFYATVLSETETTTEIEGFGINIEPFEELLDAFQARFGMEPDVFVRPVTPNQCAVVEFLRGLDAASLAAPALTLDRSTIPRGFPLKGNVAFPSVSIANLLLVDGKGMAFNLDGHLVQNASNTSFSVPADLQDGEVAAGRDVPYLIIAVAAEAEILAASFSGPKPASALLSEMLAEIRARGLESAATAKYFQRGG